MTEHDLQNLIRLELSSQKYAVFRANVGKIKLSDGRWFDTGLPKGFSDLFAIKNGSVAFLEVKLKTGRLTQEQSKFLTVMQDVYGCKAGVCRSVEDAFKILQ